MASRRNGVHDTNIAVAFLWPVKWFLGVILIYMLLGLAAIAAALVYAKFQGTEPARTTESLFQTESARVSDLLGSGKYSGRYTSLPVFTQRWSYWFFFQTTRIHEVALLAQTGAPITDPFDKTLARFVTRNIQELYVAMNAIQVYGFRVGFLLAAIPLFGLIFMVSIVDGFTERYIRRASSGRESADLNKLGRLAKLMFFATAISVYVCLPVPVSPFWVIVPMAAIYAVGTRVQWQFYKKYF